VADGPVESIDRYPPEASKREPGSAIDDSPELVSPLTQAALRASPRSRADHIA
jgi:hypothetical protein